MSQEKDMGVRNYETEQADDVATLYSWANLHGAKYRDFSGARQEMRAQMRQKALAEQARTAREEAQKLPAALEQEPEWDDIVPHASARVADDAPARESGSTGAESAAGGRDGRAEPYSEVPSARNSSEVRMSSSGNQATAPRNEQPAIRSSADNRVQANGFHGAAYGSGLQNGAFGAHAPASHNSGSQTSGSAASGSAASGPRYPLLGQQEFVPVQRTSGTRPPEIPAAGPAPGPAWLVEKKPSAPHVQPAESLQQSRERVASRWFALQSVFGRERQTPSVGGGDSRSPALTVFSLAGGVGKSSLLATLGRALAARGERVLLADTCAFGLLPFYFGAREVKPGVVRTFSGAPSDPPVRVLSLDAERESTDADLLRREIARAAPDAGRVMIDVATGSVGVMRQALRLSAVVLVPIVPDMASVLTLQSLESFFRSQEQTGGRPVQAWYLLNKFDPSVPLHLDLREVLRQQLGEQLLPFAVHRNIGFSEALAEGMTVVDYAPNSPAVEDLMNLVTWVRSASAATAAGYRGTRWSER